MERRIKIAVSVIIAVSIVTTSVVYVLLEHHGQTQQGIPDWHSQPFIVGSTKITFSPAGSYVYLGNNSFLSGWTFSGSALPAGTAEPNFSLSRSSGSMLIEEKSAFGDYSMDESYLGNNSSVSMYLSVNSSGNAISTVQYSFAIQSSIYGSAQHNASVTLTNGTSYSIKAIPPPFANSVTYTLSAQTEMIELGNLTYTFYYLDPQLGEFNLTIQKYSYEIVFHSESLKFIPGYAEKFGPVIISR